MEDRRNRKNVERKEESYDRGKEGRREGEKGNGR